LGVRGFASYAVAVADMSQSSREEDSPAVGEESGAFGRGSFAPSVRTFLIADVSIVDRSPTTDGVSGTPPRVVLPASTCARIPKLSLLCATRHTLRIGHGALFD